MGAARSRQRCSRDRPFRTLTGHHQSQYFSRCVRRDDADDAAPVEHHDAVRERGDLVELGGDHEDRGPGVAARDDLLVDELDRPHVHAAGRLGGHEQRDVAGELAGDHDLLLVASGQLRGQRRDARCADVVLLDLLLRERLEPVELERASADEGLAVAPVEHEVLGDRELADQPLGLPVLGDEPDAGVEDVPDRAPDELLTVEADRPVDVVLQAEQGLGELGLPVALYAGDGEDLARADREADVVDVDATRVVVDTQPLDDQGVLAGLLRLLVHGQLDWTTDHERGELGVRGGRLGLADDLAEPDDRDPVGDLADLAQLVGDEDDGLPGRLELAHDLHQLVGLLGRQDGRGLVEHEHLGVARERLDDLDPLLDADGEVLDEGVGVDVEAELVGDLLDPAAGGLEVEGAGEAGGLVAEHDVLGDGEDGDQHEVLVDHADAGRDGVTGPGEVLDDAVELDLARRRPGRGRRGRSSASTCRRRSRRGGRGSRPARRSG